MHRVSENRRLSSLDPDIPQTYRNYDLASIRSDHEEVNHYNLRMNGEHCDAQFLAELLNLLGSLDQFIDISLSAPVELLVTREFLRCVCFKIGKP